MWCSTVGCMVTLMLSLLVVPLVAEVQQPKQVPRIGFLETSSAEDAKSRLAAFQQGLHELGYVEGKHIIIEYRSAEGKYERLLVFAADLLRLQVNVLVAAGEPAAHAAKNATITIPIVFATAIASGGSCCNFRRRGRSANTFKQATQASLFQNNAPVIIGAISSFSIPQTRHHVANRS